VKDTARPPCLATMAQANAELRRLVAQRSFGAFCKLRDLGYWRSSFGVRAKFFDVCLRILATNSSLHFLSHYYSPSSH
jgi:hypothetical protein